MKTYLVTGAAGFIGSHLCELLVEKGHQVVGVDNFDPFYSRGIKEANLRELNGHHSFTFLEGDLTDPRVFDAFPTDVQTVIHLAGKAGVRPSIADPHGYLEANITATLNVLRWMHDNCIRKMVFGSSSSVYGNQEKVPFAEDDQVNEPISPYAFSKKSCELLNYTYHSLYGIDVVNLRFFTVYGPRQRPDLAIRKFTNLIHANQTIPMYGDGTTGRDYTYIADIADGILKAMDYVHSKDGIYEIINLGNHSPVLLGDLIELLGKLLDKEVTVKQLPMQPGDVRQTYADITKARALLNFEPKTSIEDGLKQFLEWYHEQQ